MKKNFIQNVCSEEWVKPKDTILIPFDSILRKDKEYIIAN